VTHFTGRFGQKKNLPDPLDVVPRQVDSGQNVHLRILPIQVDFGTTQKQRRAVFKSTIQHGFFPENIVWFFSV